MVQKTNLGELLKLEEIIAKKTCVGTTDDHLTEYINKYKGKKALDELRMESLTKYAMESLPKFERVNAPKYINECKKALESIKIESSAKYTIEDTAKTKMENLPRTSIKSIMVKYEKRKDCAMDIINKIEPPLFYIPKFQYPDFEKFKKDK